MSAELPTVEQSAAAAAAAVADSKTPPGDEYDEIREQVCCVFVVFDSIWN